MNQSKKQHEKKAVKPFLVSSGSYAERGYTPSMLKRYYGADGTFPTGKGITCGIVTAYGSPTLIEDLSVFSHAFSLPMADVTVMGAENVSEDKGEWILESSFDSQWLHAFAPEAKLLCYFAPSDDFSDIMDTLYKADRECDLVSLSFGRSEFESEGEYETFFSNSHAFFIAAAGDESAVQYPSCSAGILCVGGSLLFLDSAGDALGEESVWNRTGSGVSRYLNAPEHQIYFDAITVCSGGKRAIPDLSLFAKGEYGAAFYHSTTVSGFSGWTDAVGTSVATPCVAGLCAGLAQKNRNILTERARFFYDAAGKTAYTNPYRAFFDIVLGKSGEEAATIGFDFCSGLGSPRGKILESRAAVGSK